MVIVQFALNVTGVASLGEAQFNVEQTSLRGTSGTKQPCL